MYHWNTAQLAEDLKKGSLKERDRLRYYLCGTLLTTFLYEMALNTPVGSEAAWLTHMIGVLLITFFGIGFCFQVNERGDNKEFLNRIICLSWPIGIKIVLLGFVIAMGSMLLMGDLFLADDSAIGDMMIVGADLLLGALFYQRMYVHMEEIARKKK